MQVIEDDGKKLYNARANSSFVMIDEMNHVLKKVSDNLTANVATYNLQELRLHPDLLPAIMRFIKANIRHKAIPKASIQRLHSEVP